MKTDAHLKTFVDAYFAEIPEDGKIEEVSAVARNAEIIRCKSEKTARQKYYVWKLLEQAFLRSFKKSLGEFSPYKDRFGKWRAEGAEFSLSHSGNVVAVAVSSAPVGTDVEMFLPERFEKRLADKILTESERIEYSAADPQKKPVYLAGQWSKKESVFKILGGKTVISRIETKKFETFCEIVTVGVYKYVLSAASAEKAVFSVYRLEDMH